ncbi:MAG: phenylalanine--tRNA ligase subunit beta [bacterium]
MKATLGWIREFVPCDLDAPELAEALTHRGLECRASLEGTLEGVVVGEVLEVEPHPRSEKLRVCKVRAGKEFLSVVCGAANVRPGIKAPLAMVGARIPSGMLVQALEIRGVSSEGMLCSEAELELGDDASGIWILPEHLPSGQRLDAVLDLSDWVLSFDLTPNRADCLSVLGICFEVAAITGAKVSIPEMELQERGAPMAGRFQVEIRDPELCPRYVARMVEGVKIKPSPLWMRRRLQLVGLRPINNVVDVTNYVMWELGQPLHAFDLELLEGSCIVVQRARPGEKFISLDGQTRDLGPEMLMIWDGQRPVAVAGVMGGENSEVRAQTTNVLIESAFFNPMSIRRTAKALGMNTEASKRFERGVDPEGCPRAARRAALLMADLAGGTVARGELDVYPNPQPPKTVKLRVSRVNALLGTTLGAKEVKHCLELLSMEVQESSQDMFMVKPPTRRVDLTREIDLVEEVARVWGFHRIPNSLPGRRLSIVEHGVEWNWESRIREILVGFGFNEVITFSFMDPAILDRMGLSVGDPMRATLKLKNPLRQDQGVMRTSLVPGLLDAVHGNLHRRNNDLRLFELGRVFLPREGELLPEEPRRLAGVMVGQRTPLHWSSSSASVDFFDLKGVLEGLVCELRIGDVSFLGGECPSFLNPAAAARVVSGHRELGWLGELDPEVQRKWDLELPVLLFEMDLELLLELSVTVPRYSALPRFPEVVRDLSIIVGEDIPAGRLLQFIRDHGGQWLENVVLYDLFQDPAKLPAGTKSLTFRLWFRSREGSLTDEAVNLEQQRILEGMEETLGAKLRT